MKTKSVVVAAVSAAIVVGIVGVIMASSSAPSAPSLAGDTPDGMERIYGTIDTAMGSPIMGDPSAPITIVEFGDYQCHQCYNWFHNTKPAIASNYIETGKANLIFVDMAFLGRDSPKAAQASHCADDQGMYWQYHDMLYNLQDPEIDGGWANTERLMAIAFGLDLDMEVFNECFDSGKHVKRVLFNTQQARDNGINGTPTFFIVSGDVQQRIVGAQPYTTFKQAMDSMM